MIKPTRRDLLKLLLAAPLAAIVDYERLLWVKTPMVTVPGPAIRWDWQGWMEHPYKHGWFGWLAAYRTEVGHEADPYFAYRIEESALQRQRHGISDLTAERSFAKRVLDDYLHDQPWPQTSAQLGTFL